MPNQPSSSHNRQPSKHKSIAAGSSKVQVPSTSKDAKKDQTPNTAVYPKKSRTSTKKDMEKVCNETVTVPPQLPDILKQYAKGAMKTQPPDLLRWSGLYFRSMANGEPLPVKDRLEFPLKESKDGLTAGLLRVLDTQIGSSGGNKVSTNHVLKKWRGMGLSVEAFNTILEKANMAEDNMVEWDKLMAIMAFTIGKKLKGAMKVLCEVLTDQPDGMEPLMSFKMWWILYLYLAKFNSEVPDDKIQALKDYLTPLTTENAGHIGPRDFNSTRCPPLE